MQDIFIDRQSGSMFSNWSRSDFGEMLVHKFHLEPSENQFMDLYSFVALPEEPPKKTDLNFETV